MSGIIISGLIFFSFFKFSKFIEDRIKAKIEKTSLLESTRSGLIPIIIRYTIIVIGFFISLEFLNIDLTSLKVLIGALGVGIGFGLREIVNNLISGIILLSDKTVVKNDLIEVKGLIGRVEKIGIRTTTIRTFNNFEVIIPNTELVNNELINHTHSDSIIRIVIPIGISYSSDPFLVKEILTKSLSKLNGILKDHPIEVFFTEFGENSLKFEISIWIDDPFKRKKIESEARFVIWKTLKENKIEIPYPQLDVHLKKS
ncbi:MAG: mechanosensitive ion channel domain-containing protein [candidate division WOR-3 bacterium]